VEAYKIADLLAKEGIASSIWADWGSFKMEALDAVKGNMALVDHAGARVIVHSDDPSGSQRLNQEAAKAMAAGAEIGLPVSEERAIKWLTINPAWALGLDDRIGSLEPGKNADVVLWSGDPFSVYSRAEKVWIDGALLYDRSDPYEQWRTDFGARLRAVQQELNDEITHFSYRHFVRGCNRDNRARRRADDRNYRRQGLPGERASHRGWHRRNRERQDRGGRQ